MADTIGVVRLSGGDWENIHDLSGIGQGTGFYLQSQSSTLIMVAISATKPEKNFKGMILPADFRFYGVVTPGENTVWLYGTGPVSVQES